jgi:hypothetical protein
MDANLVLLGAFLTLGIKLVLVICSIAILVTTRYNSLSLKQKAYYWATAYTTPIAIMWIGVFVIMLDGKMNLTQFCFLILASVTPILTQRASAHIRVCTQ